MPQSTPSDQLVTKLDEMAQQTIGAAYSGLGAAFRAGLWKVIADALVAWSPTQALVRWRVQDIAAATFTFEIGGVVSLSDPLAYAPSTVEGLRGAFVLLRGGVDNMLWVEDTPNAAAEWTIDNLNRVVIFGDVTQSGATYRVRYATTA